MEFYKTALVFVAVFAMTTAQRPFYAGSKPIGYPETAGSNFLANRFGESDNYPIEARGDGNLINRIEQMPVDQRPFWYTNSKQYDDLRRNPQTYPQRPNNFANTFNRLRSRK